MKIIRFLGGLGNQMFQYAFYELLKQRFGNVKVDLSAYKEHVHNGFELERIFNIKLKQASQLEINLRDHRNRKWKYRKLRRITFLKPRYYEEEFLFSYDESLFVNTSLKIYSGYWQNYRYLNSVSDKLRQSFIFPKLVQLKDINLFEELQRQEESVAIHVRRGDYIKDPFLGGLVGLGYFEDGISIMKRQLTNPKFYVFSDDIEWCKINLNLHDAVFVDWNKGLDSFRDMQLMSRCKHAIISNSSFSWWAAWLNPFVDKLVVVPKVWWKGPHASNTVDMHPKEWIRIENL